MLSSVCVIDSCKHCPNDDFTDYPLQNYRNVNIILLPEKSYGKKRKKKNQVCLLINRERCIQHADLRGSPLLERFK
jgi:hypothetical protein